MHVCFYMDTFSPSPPVSNSNSKPFLFFFFFFFFFLVDIACSRHPPLFSTLTITNSSSSMPQQQSQLWSSSTLQDVGKRNVWNTSSTSTKKKMRARNLQQGGIELEYSSSSSSCATGNPIDDCWRCDPEWEANRKKLAECAIGFGKDAMGGKEGEYYVVTDPSDEDAVNPKAGTLRHAVIQEEPLWIIFDSDMKIVLKEELLMNSYKTIDGRGHEVHVADGACITMQGVSNIIVHGIYVHDCKPAGNAMVRDSPTHFGWRTRSDGDGISLFGAVDVWVDHVSLATCTDGLFDAIMGSTRITVSNSYFTHHNKVMLLSHSDDYVADKTMQATVAFNHFGEGLVQRMPRCRHGFFEIVNNDYTHWEMYAIGGSAAPTINSKGNRYTAPTDPFAKDVTMRMDTPESKWETWDWRSEGDLFLNGAFFVPSGAEASSNYQKDATMGPKPSSLVGILTASAGALSCTVGSPC